MTDDEIIRMVQSGYSSNTLVANLADRLAYMHDALEELGPEDDSDDSE